MPQLSPGGHAVAGNAVVVVTGDHGSLDPKIFPTTVVPNGKGVYTLPVVSPTRGNSRILEAGRRRSGPASCGSLARTVLVAGCVPDRKNEVV